MRIISLILLLSSLAFAQGQFLGGGGGSGSGTVSGTTGFIAKFSGATAVGNSACDDGITTASTITCTEPIAVTGSTVLTPSTAGAGDAGSSALPFRNIFFAGASGTPASNNGELTGTFTGGRIFTFPDRSTTIAGQSGSFTSGNGVKANSNGDLIDLGGISLTPFARDTFWLKDDFPHNNNTDGLTGELGWGTDTFTSCTFADIAPPDALHYGIVQMTTGAAAGNGCGIEFKRSNTGMLPDMTTATNFEYQWIFKNASAANTDLELYVGAFGVNGGVCRPNNFVGVKFDTAAGSGDSDTNFELTARSGGTGTSTADVAIDTNWHRLRVRSTVAGTVLISLDGGTEASINTNVPSGSLTPGFIICSATGGGWRCQNRSSGLVRFPQNGVDPLRYIATLLLLLASATAQMQYAGVKMSGISSGNTWPSGQTSYFNINFEDGTYGGISTSCGSGPTCTSTNCNTRIDSTDGANGTSKSLILEIPTSATASAECSPIMIVSSYIAALPSGYTISVWMKPNQTLLDHSSTTSCTAASFCQDKLFLERGRRGASTFNPPSLTVPDLNTNTASGLAQIINDYGNNPIGCPVVSATRSGNSVTVTCRFPHGLTLGAASGSAYAYDMADTTFNGNASTPHFVGNMSNVPSTTTFTYSQTAANATSGFGGTAGPNAANVSMVANTWTHFEIFHEINDNYPTGHIIFWQDGVVKREGIGFTDAPMGGVAATAIVAAGRVCTATVQTIGANSIQAGDAVVIRGAQSGFGGTVTVLASPAPTTTSFAYNCPVSDGPAATQTGWNSKGVVQFDAAQMGIRTVLGIAFGEDQGSSGNWEGIMKVDEIVIASGRPR